VEQTVSEAAIVANVAAGIEVGTLAEATVSVAEILAFAAEHLADWSARRLDVRAPQ
jgi:bifunctional ADP-heptose synthase (sugar kinase/adenylyltransferase)